MSESHDHQKLNEDRRAKLFEALKEIGAVGVMVQYTGYGDSGQIESVTAWKAGQNYENGHASLSVRVSFPKLRISYVRDESSDTLQRREKFVNEEMSLRDAIEEFCWDALEERHGGWENEEGGNGTFEFSVEDGTIDFTHNEAYVEYNTSMYEI